MPRVRPIAAFKRPSRGARVGRARASAFFGGGLAFVVVGLALRAGAGPLLHEPFSPNPSEDTLYGATNSRGTMPAWLHTKSGWVSAPDPVDAPWNSQPGAARYGGVRNAADAASKFVLDNLTSRPSRVEYDEVFRPSVVPYKRLYVYDQVSESFALGVRDPALKARSTSPGLGAGDDAFFGDFEVDLVAHVPVRIPSVGPGSKVLAVVVDPPRPVELLVDSAENWFVRAEEGGRVRMYLQLGVPRQAFGSQFLPISRAALRPYLPPVPTAVAQMAQEVLLHIGAAKETVPTAALMQLVSYFRSFRESDVLPQARIQSELYREISLTQKGVCRHRAYAFVVTALTWGLPARLVHNEAHAWAEVFDSELWHRIDLGGAASDLVVPEDQTAALRHRPPSDPFAWPTEERSAAVEFERRLVEAQRGAAKHDLDAGTSPGPGAGVVKASSGQVGPSGQGPSTIPDARFEASGAASGSRDQLPAQGPTTTSAAGDSPQVEFQVRGAPHDAAPRDHIYARGTTISVTGTVTHKGQPCALSRVDVVLGLPSAALSVGSLATDGSGHFAGQVTLPSTLPVGKTRVDVVVGSACRTSVVEAPHD